MSSFRCGQAVIDRVTGKRWTVDFVNKLGVFLSDESGDRCMFTWRESGARLQALGVERQS